MTAPYRYPQDFCLGCQRTIEFRQGRVFGCICLRQAAESREDVPPGYGFEIPAGATIDRVSDG